MNLLKRVNCLLVRRLLNNTLLTIWKISEYNRLPIYKYSANGICNPPKDRLVTYCLLADRWHILRRYSLRRARSFTYTLYLLSYEKLWKMFKTASVIESLLSELKQYYFEQNFIIIYKTLSLAFNCCSVFKTNTVQKQKPV